MKHTQEKIEIDNGYKLAWLLTNDRWEENRERISALWNAADGMTTEEAVRYLEHGREIEAMLWDIYDDLEVTSAVELGELIRKIRKAKMEG